MKYKIEIVEANVGMQGHYRIHFDDGLRPAFSTATRDLFEISALTLRFIQDSCQYESGYQAGLKAANEANAQTGNEPQTD